MTGPSLIQIIYEAKVQIEYQFQHFCIRKRHSWKNYNYSLKSYYIWSKCDSLLTTTLVTYIFKNKLCQNLNNSRFWWNQKQSHNVLHKILHLKCTDWFALCFEIISKMWNPRAILHVISLKPWPKLIIFKVLSCPSSSWKLPL